MTTTAVPKFYPPPEEQAAARLLGIKAWSLWSIVGSMGRAGSGRFFFAVPYGTDPSNYILRQWTVAADQLLPRSLVRHSLHERVCLSAQFLRDETGAVVQEAPVHRWLSRLAWEGERPMFISRGYLLCQEKKG